ncbi:MAG: Bug family tripartite tricarboxylate transporter substrate binding protein [Lautropia sp.]
MRNTHRSNGARALLGAICAVVMTAGAPWAAGTARADTWPSKPIRLIVPYPPGGQTDIVSRWLGEKLSPILGQPIVIENKAGAQGIVGLSAGKQAAPDGYTFVYANVSNLLINKFAYAKLPYDTADFEMVTQLGLAPLGMVVQKEMGVKTVAEFVERIGKAGTKASFASFGAGSSSHLYGEMFKDAAKLDMVHVAYKGAGPAVQDIVGGNATMGIQDFAATKPFRDAGRLSLLAVTGPRRWPLAPDVPTFAEQGFPLDLAGWNGIVAPRGTPVAIVDRVSREINALIQSKEGTEKLLQMGLLATGTTPAAFRAAIERDLPRWGDVYRRTGLTPQ